MASALTVGTDPTSNQVRATPQPAAPRKRKARERISLGHLFMIAAGLLAFVLVVSLLQDRRLTTSVLVAEADILPGTTLTLDLVTEVDLPADNDLVASFATLDTIAAGNVTVGQRIAAGDPITMTALAPAANSSGQRAMSFAIDRLNAVGGDLAAGDRIDVISVTGAASLYVATNLEVLATQQSDGRTGALGSGAALSTYFVTVSVDDQTALDLALALRTSDVFLVRSTGAGPVGQTTASPPADPEADTTLPDAGPDVDPGAGEPGAETGAAPTTDTAGTPSPEAGASG